MKRLSDDRFAVLLKGINKGDERAFSQLYMLYYAPLCLYADRFVKDSAAAEDIVEEAFLKLWEQRRTFKTSDHLGAFLYRSIKNACLDFIKINMRETLRHEAYAADNYQIPDTDYLTNIVRTEIVVNLYRAIALLPPKVGSIIQKTYIDGKSNQEVADEMGISLQTVKNQKNRGLGLLRKHIGKEHLNFLVLGLAAAHTLTFCKI